MYHKICVRSQYLPCIKIYSVYLNEARGQAEESKGKAPAMQLREQAASTEEQKAPLNRCPIDHTGFSQQKTARNVVTDPRIERDAAGVWQVRGFEEARAILRGSDTRQAGFGAEMLERIPGQRNQPILYQEGKVHQQQRKQTARFFTPKTVSTSYRQMMETLSDQMVAMLQERKRADLSKIALRLAMRVAGQVVGLTNSRLPGLERRIDAFFEEAPADLKLSPRRLLRVLKIQYRMAAFFFLDVKPAIEARKKRPQEDVISHLLGLHYSDSEILTECVTYAAAGMVTTREFISVAAWHLLEQSALRARYLVAPEAERHAILEETLRLEPVIGNIRRRATADIHLESQGEHVLIPQGAPIDIQVHGTNSDERVVGEEPLALCPDRELTGERVPAEMMSFGDGHHRCPGSYLAIQEADIFLQRLLKLEGLRIERPPTMRWSDLTTGYELRKFIVAVG
jgi:cytochrome P450